MITARAEHLARAGPFPVALRALALSSDEADWIRAAVAAGRGRFDDAVALARALLARSRDVSLRARASITLASTLRQIGRHADAVAHDRRALDLAPSADERAHALIGLAADAVGGRRAGAAARLLADAARCSSGWRSAVRLRWVRAEVALLEGRPRAAAATAAEAVVLAGRAQAPRHVAKSLLFEGTARAEAGDPHARELLAAAEARAIALGATPVARAARLVLEHHPGARRARR